MTDQHVLQLLRDHGVEVWAEQPDDQMAVVVTFGTLKKLLAASASAEPVRMSQEAFRHQMEAAYELGAQEAAPRPIEAPAQAVALSETRADIAADRHFINGVKLGWNFRDANDEKGFQACIEGRAKQIQDARAALSAPASMSAEPRPWRAENVGAIHDEMVRSGFMSRFANESATPSAENRPAQGNVRDAQRLDWLAEEDEMGFFYNIDHISANINEGFNGFKTLREAIDAAIASQSAKEPK